MQTRLNSMRLSEKPWLAFMKKNWLSSWEICSQRQVLLQFHHLVGCYHPKTLKIECHQKAKLWEKQCTIRVLSTILTLLRPFARNFIFGTEANISARAEVCHVIATNFQPGWLGWNLPCNQALKKALATWQYGFFLLAPRFMTFLLWDVQKSNFGWVSDLRL